MTIPSVPGSVVKNHLLVVEDVKEVLDEDVVVELAPEQLEAMDEAVERFKARRSQARDEERRLAKHDRR
jgi:hypothetical protein